MTTELENYYLKHPEPIQGCLLALKGIILQTHNLIIQQRKYQIPFFYYKGKKLCFLWVYRKKPLIGFVEDKSIQAPSAGLKIKDKIETIPLDPESDLPIVLIREMILQKIDLYDSSFV